MDDEPGRLVDDRERVVDVDDPQLGAAAHFCSAGEAERQQEHAEGDRDVGEVERRPGEDVDVVGHRVGPDPVGEVAERAAGEEADRDPHPGSGRVAGEEPADEDQAAEREGDQEAAAVAGEAEGDAAVVGEGEADRPEDVDVLARDRGAPRPPP